MIKMYLLFVTSLIFAFCQSEQQPRQAMSQGLHKVYYKNQEQVQKLRDAGAEIIVQQPDYVIIKTDKMVSAQDIKSEPIKESDLIQRLIKIYLKDSTDLQIAVNSGIDLWEVKNDTVIARAFDIYIEQLKKAGLSVEIIAANASKREDK